MIDPQAPPRNTFEVLTQLRLVVEADTTVEAADVALALLSQLRAEITAHGIEVVGVQPVLG